jgi:hypothetical protein
MDLPPSDDEIPLAELKQRRRSVSEKKKTKAPTSKARDVKKTSDDVLPVAEQNRKGRKTAGKEEELDEACGTKEKARGRTRKKHDETGIVEKKTRGRPRKMSDNALRDDLPTKNMSKRSQIERTKVNRKGVVDEESDDDTDNYPGGEKASKSVECEDDLHNPEKKANRKSPVSPPLTKRQPLRQKGERPRRKARQKSKDEDDDEDKDQDCNVGTGGVDSLDVSTSPQDVDGRGQTSGQQAKESQTAGRRRRRASNKVIDDDAEENEEARDGQSSITSQTPEDVNSDDGMDDPNDPDHIYGEEKEEKNLKSRRSKRRRLDTKPKNKSENPRLTCPHCQKPMSSKAGLQYHLGKPRDGRW